MINYAPESTEETIPEPLIKRNKDYVFDKHLRVSETLCLDRINNTELELPNVNECETPFTNNLTSTVSQFPCLKEFVYFASVAYYKNDKLSGTLKLTNEDFGRKNTKPVGYTFLAQGRNKQKLNGYYGVAYINRDKRQIILSHRGTAISNVGALWTDGMAVFMKQYAPQVSSAMTFAYRVFNFAMEHECEVFFTGHSLGAWLAQITTFSTMFLTKDSTSEYFVRRPPPYKSVYTPYTAVFDSPGAFEFLEKMRRKLFPHQDINSQEINVDILPVEVYQFYPNAINTTNKSVGTVYLVDLDKEQVRKKGVLGLATHSLGPIETLINGGTEESGLMSCQVIDFRVSTLQLIKNKWKNETQTIPVDLNKFSVHFFNGEEQEWLKNASRDVSHGNFEGINPSTEEIANKLVGKVGDDFAWKLLEDFGGSVVDVGGWDKREFIPNVRHTLRCIMRGTLWWNPNPANLPVNYIERKVHKVPADPQRFLFLVDPPGMGKSSWMTHQELILRDQLTPELRVVVRVNLNQVQNVLQDQMETNQKAYELSNVSDFLKQFAEYIPVKELQYALSQRGVNELPVYVLLDGLDEVCPEYEQVMLNVLHVLFPGKENPDRCFHVNNLVLTSRPHLQTVIQDTFQVKAVSLVPLTLEEQVEFLTNTLNPKDPNFTQTNVEEILKALSDMVQSLMKNPLMLYIYSQIAVIPTEPSRETKQTLDVFQLYSRFMDKKHQVYLTNKEEADLAKQHTKRRVKSLLQDNLKHYYFFTGNDLLIRRWTESMQNISLVQKPTSLKLDELLSYGLLIMEGSRVRFKHRSFAEFFYSCLLMETQLPQSTKDTLFRNLYEKQILFNVEEFVLQMVLQRQLGSSASSFQTNNSLLNITGGWLTGTDKRNTLLNYLSGKLCELLSDEVFAGLNYKEPQVIEALIIDCYFNGYFGKWLVLQNRNYVRRIVLQLKSEEEMSQNTLELITALITCKYTKETILDFVTIAEITHAVNSCERIIDVARKLSGTNINGMIALMGSVEVQKQPEGSPNKCIIDVQRLKIFIEPSFESILKGKVEHLCPVTLQWEETTIKSVGDEYSTLIAPQWACEFVGDPVHKIHCISCTQNGAPDVVEDLFHVLCQCEMYSELRLNYLGSYELPGSKHRTLEFLSNTTSGALRNLFKYLKGVMKVRKENNL